MFLSSCHFSRFKQLLFVQQRAPNMRRAIPSPDIDREIQTIRILQSLERAGSCSVAASSWFDDDCDSEHSESWEEAVSSAENHFALTELMQQLTSADEWADKILEMSHEDFIRSIESRVAASMQTEGSLHLESKAHVVQEKSLPVLQTFIIKFGRIAECFIIGLPETVRARLKAGVEDTVMAAVRFLNRVLRGFGSDIFLQDANDAERDEEQCDLDHDEDIAIVD